MPALFLHGVSGSCLMLARQELGNPYQKKAAYKQAVLSYPTAAPLRQGTGAKQVNSMIWKRKNYGWPNEVLLLSMLFPEPDLGSGFP